MNKYYFSELIIFCFFFSLEIYQSTDEYLGQGACGTVRTFFSVEKRKEFAVKIIRNTSTRVRSKVLKEIEILHHCKGHENIVQLQEFYEEDKNFYLVFEKMSGGTLLERLTRDGPLPELDVSKIVGGLASALKFLHDRSVAHRDLKLENILCSAPGDSSSSYNQDGNLSGLHPVKLCDFDLSTEFSEPTYTQPPTTTKTTTNQSQVGSIDYMAPEVVSVWLYESDQYTEQCDLWSLGVVMFILLSGLKPIVARRPHNCVCRDSNYEYICDYCREEHFEEIKRGRYDMSGPEWSSISEGAKDLIRYLLVVDPTKRLTAQQVLAHPWIVDPLSHLRIPDPLVHSLSVVDPSRTRMSAPVPIPCSPYGLLQLSILFIIYYIH
ncbi:hypothetical protein HELRODRAFT_89337 [Helobdella robusta]|uniref:Protein kinase domain-containing protein n=1 Tax=Helobdella robusta TaxID=6412 RepID=T1G7C3_HELRO|nr:hypothetical protein HELRODRAFT_89337 [Helobdella robusta]ESN92473.1 hypothetical protein HELRODRAFT_89337 [Helobdella robusta]